jgi:hypothetical protein
MSSQEQSKKPISYKAISCPELARAWIKTRYTPIVLFGREPLYDDRFGIKILKKK